MILNQVFDAINIGIVILDREMKVKKWNRWMEIHSGINADKIIDSSIYVFFPDLEIEDCFKCKEFKKCWNLE